MRDPLNEVQLEGRVSMNPQIATLLVKKKEISYTTFILEIDQKNSEKEFITVSFWGEKATIVLCELKKGDWDLIEGRLQYPVSNGQSHMSIKGDNYLALKGYSGKSRD